MKFNLVVKTFFLLLIALLLSFYGNSQTVAETKFKVGKKDKSHGLIELNFNYQKGGFLIYGIQKQRNRKAGSKLSITFFDENAQKTGKATIPVPKKGILRDIVYNGDEVAIQIVCYKLFRPYVKYYVYNLQGERISSKKYSSRGDKALRKQLRRGLHYSPKIFPSLGGFLVVNYNKTYYDGYSIKKVDKNFDTQWVRKIAPNKRKEIVRLLGVQEHNGLIATISQRCKLFRYKESALELNVYEFEEGDLLFTKTLQKGKTMYYPNQMLVEANQDIVLTGTYFNGKYKNGVPKGIFITKYDPNGKLIYDSLIPWNKYLKKNAKRGTRDLDLVKGRLKYNVQSIVKNGDSYNVVAEMYRRDINIPLEILKAIVNTVSYNPRYGVTSYGGGNNSNTWILEKQDFIVVNADAKNGRYQNSTIVDKKPERVVYPPQALKSKFFLFTFNNPHSFTFRKGSETNSYFIYRKKANRKNKAYSLVKINENGNVEEQELRIDEDGGKLRNKDKYGIAKVNDANVLIYKYEGGRKSRQYKLRIEEVDKNLILKPYEASSAVKQEKIGVYQKSEKKRKAEREKLAKIEEKRKAKEAAKLKAAEEKAAKIEAIKAEIARKKELQLQQKEEEKEAAKIEEKQVELQQLPEPEVKKVKKIEDYTDEELKDLDGEDLDKQQRLLNFREKRLKKLLEIKRNKQKEENN